MREYVWDPLKWHLPIPPRVVDAMDEAQKWAIACTREALEDYGYPKRPLDLDRTAVILGNAMAGEKHYLTVDARATFRNTPANWPKAPVSPRCRQTVRRDITRELHDRIGKRLPEITEDSMPGELANCIAGRIANLFNFHGPNYVVDAACASAMAAISSAAEGLIENDFDVAVTGGIDRNMGASTFVKFCKIGALSATGTRPYAEGADGFVMGEGAAIFLLKRLADAERDGDKIYAVLRGIGGSSDGKGKGITAPNPIGQKLCHRARLAECRLIARHRDVDRRPRHIHPRGRRGRSAKHGGRAQQFPSPRRLGGARLGQIEHRASERSGRRCRIAESRPGAARQGAAAQRALRASQSGYRLRPLSALRQYRTETVDGAGGWRAARRRERLWFWRHQFPRRAGGIHSRTG